MWRNSRLATRRCQGTSAVAAVWSRGLAVHIAHQLRPAAPAAAVSLDQKLQGTRKRRNGWKLRGFLIWKNFEKSEMKRLRRFASPSPAVVFFLLIGERHASTAHREGNAGFAGIDMQGFLFAKRSRSENIVMIHTSMHASQLVYHIMIVLMHFSHDSRFIFILKQTLFIWKWWYLKISAFLRSEFRRQFWLYDLRQVWWKASHGTVPAFSERSWKTQRCVGSGSPAFWCKFSFKVSEWNIFLCLKRAEWVRVRDRILTHFCLPFSCINPKLRWIMDAKIIPIRWEEVAVTMSCGHLSQATAVILVENNTFSWIQQTIAATRNARVISQPGDGSCLYHSISFGLGDTDRFVMIEWTDEWNFLFVVFCICVASLDSFFQRYPLFFVTFLFLYDREEWCDMSHYYVLHDCIILYLFKAPLMFGPFLSQTRNTKKNRTAKRCAHAALAT